MQTRKRLVAIHLYVSYRGNEFNDFLLQSLETGIRHHLPQIDDVRVALLFQLAKQFQRHCFRNVTVPRLKVYRPRQRLYGG